MADQSEQNTEAAGTQVGIQARPWRWGDVNARAPLVVPAIGLMVGIVVDSVAAAAPWAYVVGAVAVAGMLLWPVVRRRGPSAAVMLLAACCGGLLHHNAYRRVPADHIVHHTVAESSALARVSGLVLTPPRISLRAGGPFGPWMYSPDRTSFLLAVDAVAQHGEFIPTSGRVRVTVKEAVMDLNAGDRVRLFGRLYRPVPPANPGQFDWAKWSRRHGVPAAMSCDNRESVEVLEPTGGGWWRARIDQLRRRARGLLLDEMLATGDPSAGLLEAMILARRTAVDSSINEAFIRIGCAHYLAASGFHVGMLALFLYGMGRAIGLTKRSAAVCVVVATVFYAIMAEPRPAIFRAVVMAVAICTGLIWRRRGGTFNLLALSAIAFLVWRPMDLFDVGFQLSYTCVIGILLFEPVLTSVFRSIARRVRGKAVVGADNDLSGPRERGQPVWRWLCSGIVTAGSVSVAAWLASLPLVVDSFHRFAPLGWLNSLLVFPVVAVVMFVGFGILLVGAVSPWLGGLLTPVLMLPAALLIGLVNVLGKAPGVMVYTSSAPLVWLAGYYAALLAWVGVYWRVVRWPVGVVVTAVWALTTVVWLAPSRASGKLTMTVLSVGSGSSMVIELPDGRAILYDAGCFGSYDPGATTIVPFLAHRGIRRLDSAIISHPNLDHFGGLLTVADRVPLGTVLVSRYFESLSPEGRVSRWLLTGLRERGVPIRQIDSSAGEFELGGATVEILWPPPEPPFELDANESSLVFRVSYRGQRILLTGDIEERAQGWLLQAGMDLSADVLLLPHHGGLTPSTAGFVEAVQPRYLIQSSSRRTAATLERLGEIVGEGKLFNTADDGAIRVVLGGAEIEVSGFRSTGAEAR